MSTLWAFLMLWGLSLAPAIEALIAFQSQPNLWAEAESLLEPWANVTLTCQARLMTTDFELFKDGVTQELVHLGAPAMEHRFPLGAVTSDTRGLYRCRSRLSSEWTQLSNLLEVTGAETLPPPVLSTEPVSWITPGLETKLLCRGVFRGVTFLLRLEGDDQFLEVAEAPTGVEATFPVHRPGNYSCSYRTHAAGAPSEPSATVKIEEPGAPLAPKLSVRGASAAFLHLGEDPTLVCIAPLSGGVHFQLRRGEEVLQVPSSSVSPESIYFDLKAMALGDGGFYTCRYQLHGQQAWSSDSAPAELLLSDQTLPAPELSAEPATLRPAPGASLQLRCRAPRPGLRFALLHEDQGQIQVHRLLSPAGTEALFELRDVSVADSGNYSCVYVDTEPPFAGSAPSAPWELRVEGPPPRPQLRPLWNGAVTPGRDAVLRCKTPVRNAWFQLLRAGEEEDWTVILTNHRSADLVLTYVGPQHVGNYTCRYYRSWPSVLKSELSEPVELQVADL